MQLNHAFRLVDASNERSCLVERRGRGGELELLRSNPSELNCSVDTLIAPARRAAGDEAAVFTRERLDRLARSLEPLPERGRLQTERVSGFRRRQTQNLTQHIG